MTDETAASKFRFKWRQAPYAVPIGLCAAILVLGWQNWWHATVTVLRILSTAVVQWLIDPLRQYFYDFSVLFEHYLMRRCIYEPLVYIGLLSGVEFLTFARTVYWAVALWLVVVLIWRLPSYRVILFSGGHLRKFWIIMPLSVLTMCCAFGGMALHWHGYVEHCYVTESFALVMAVLLGLAERRWPATNDGADFGTWLSQVRDAMPDLQPVALRLVVHCDTAPSAPPPPAVSAPSDSTDSNTYTDEEQTANITQLSGHGNTVVQRSGHTLQIVSHPGRGVRAQSRRGGYGFGL
jgi:hypothetical protein